MADKDWLGLYLPEDDGEPVALFRDGAHAHHLRVQLLNRPDAVVAATTGVGVHRAVRAQFREAEEVRTADADAVLRGQIRTQVGEQLRREAIEADVRAELGAAPASGMHRVSRTTRERLGVSEAEDAPAEAPEA